MYGFLIIRLIVTRGIAEVICFVLRLLHHCSSCAEINVKNLVTHRIFNGSAIS